ncbi:hypothetical protein FM020_06660 [Acinetobacter tandoii]|nr:hypothetical protein FM020_06660 [Acinetobacter tandoii]
MTHVTLRRGGLMQNRHSILLLRKRHKKLRNQAG